MTAGIWTISGAAFSGGLKACKEADKIPQTIGIDTWAVDFVLIDKDGNPVGDAVAYRDGRTKEADKLVDKIIPAQELYARTGIQKQLFNTIYQLMALKKEHPEELEQAQTMLMIPDYFDYKLTGVMKQEYTNATSTNLVYAAAKTWDYELIDMLGLPKKLFGELSVPGTVVGNLTEEIQKEVGFDATVILPATHDTGSAFPGGSRKRRQGSLSLQRHVVASGRGERRAHLHRGFLERELHQRGRRLVPLPLSQEHHGTVDDPVHPPRAERRRLCGGPHQQIFVRKTVNSGASRT